MSTEASTWVRENVPSNDPTLKSLLMYLASYHNPRNGKLHPSCARLVEDTGYSRATIWAKIKLAESKGWITVERTADRRYSNQYGINWKEVVIRNPDYVEVVQELDHGSPGDRLGSPGDRQGVVQELDPKSKEEKTKEENQIDLEGACAPAQVSKPPKATRWKEESSVPEDWQQWARDKFPHLDVAEEAEGFVDYWTSKPTQATKLNWPGTWRNWIRKAATQQRGKQNAKSQRTARPTTTGRHPITGETVEERYQRLYGNSESQRDTSSESDSFAGNVLERAIFGEIRRRPAAGH